MESFWMEYFDRSAIQNSNAMCKQVGKTVNGVEINDLQLDYITHSLHGNLALCKDDNLMDLCCGNGIITLRIAALVNKVIGIDFSKGLIESAQKNHFSENITYLHHDVLQLQGTFFRQATKYCMNEALQHLSPQMLDALLSNMHSLEKGTPFFIGGIPDKDQLRTYYDTDEKWQFYQQSEAVNRPHIGHWWDHKILKAIAGKNGFSFQYLSQNPKLYTAYYRFDCLLEKC